MNMYSKNPFKQINSTKSNSDNVSEPEKWAKNTHVVLEHIRKQIPQSTGHCSARKRVLKNVKCQGRLASLGKPSQPDETCHNACLGIVSDGVIISPDPEVQTRAIFIAALVDKLDRGENPFELSPRDCQSVHRTSIASSVSDQMNFPVGNIQIETLDSYNSNLHNPLEPEFSQTMNDKRASSCEPVMPIFVDINHNSITTKRSFSYA